MSSSGPTKENLLKNQQEFHNELVNALKSHTTAMNDLKEKMNALQTKLDKCNAQVEELTSKHNNMRTVNGGAKKRHRRTRKNN